MLGRSVTAVLAHLHSHSYPHGKISAETVFLDEAGKVKVLDPEYALLVASFSQGIFAPEELSSQVEGLTLVSLSDIFKMGVVLLQASLLHPLPI